jgi:glycerophosphoryl diester phosphodiesterase
MRSVKTLRAPVVLGHRGVSGTEPENSLVAFDVCANNNIIVELDCATLSDGNLGIMHDTTINRTSNGTGNPSSFTTQQWQELYLDPSTWLGAGYADTQRLPLFSEVCSLLKNRAIICPEAKTGIGAGAEIVKTLKRFRIGTDQAIVQSFSQSELTAAIASGYQTMLNFGKLSTATDFATIAATGVKYICYGTTEAGNDARIANAKAAGLEVFRYTMDRRTELATELALGCIGVFSDESIYITATAPLATRDTFANGKWMQGMIANSQNRGKMLSDGAGSYYWGYDTLVGGYYGSLMGWACPMNPSFTLNFTAKHESVVEISRWYGAFICSDDDTEHKDLLTDQVQGYQIIARQQGKLQIYKKAKGVGTVLQSEVSGAAFALDIFVTITVVVTATTITATRSDTGQSVSITDSAYRGGYFHLGRNGCSAKFKDIIIT